MNKLTKILIITAVAGFILTAMMGAENGGTMFAIPVLCGVIYLIHKVASGPRAS